MVGVNNEAEFPALGGKPVPKAARGPAGMQPLPPARPTVSAPASGDVNTPESPVLSISGMHTNAGNDEFMVFLHDHHPVAIERTCDRGSSSWPNSGFVLMETVVDYKHAVKNKSGKQVRGRKVLLQKMDVVTGGKFKSHDTPRQSQTRLCLTSWCIIRTPYVL